MRLFKLYIILEYHLETLYGVPSTTPQPLEAALFEDLWRLVVRSHRPSPQNGSFKLAMISSLKDKSIIFPSAWCSSKNKGNLDRWRLYLTLIFRVITRSIAKPSLGSDT